MKEHSGLCEEVELAHQIVQRTVAQKGILDIIGEKNGDI